MSPGLSRQLAAILGRHFVYPHERTRVIAAALDVDTYEELPADVRNLLDEIAGRGASEPRQDR